VVDRLERGVATPGRAAPAATRPDTSPKRGGWRRQVTTAIFLAPALVLLGALVLYPIFFTIWRSLFDTTGSNFVGVDNYQSMFTRPDTLRAIQNNAIWVVFAPTLATIFGLLFAVLTERISWSRAFKAAVFFPMAVSMLASGVVWRLVYDQEPELGLGNAVVQGVVHVFRPPGEYTGARPSQPDQLKADGRAYVTTRSFSPGQTASLGLIAIPPAQLPEPQVRAQAPPPAAAGALTGSVWFDFTRGGGGTRGEIDPAELGLSDVKVEALSDGRVVASDQTSDTGVFEFRDLPQGSYTVRLADSNFRPPYGGFYWLGPTLVTPAIIFVFLWIWAGFAMVVIAAGLSALPREVLEAARVDGASEWQVFRRVTAPLLMPVITVVLVTLAINVLKIFDLVLIIPPGSSQNAANVLALEMWRVSFGGGLDQGLGSAVAVFLFVLVLPAMIFNFRRFRAENR
jgi:alpha-glucoside transport system permease protein